MAFCWVLQLSVLSTKEELKAGYKTNRPSPRAFTRSAINSRIIDEFAPNCHQLICGSRVLLLLARWLHKTHRNYTITACSSINTVDLYASIWPQTTKFNSRREYWSLATASAQQCSTCYGRDGTVASRSINWENNIEALVSFKKIQFAVGSPKQIRIL